ncbi:unnamed protein product, partial [marine sediment metagenome]
MTKLIIENRTELSDIDILDLVKAVIKEGRISNNGKQYCCGTIVQIENKHYG